MTDTKIVIVGAGAAGLTAAKELQRLEQDFLLLEASHRIGGRAYTEVLGPSIDDAKRGNTVAGNLKLLVRVGFLIGVMSSLAACEPRDVRPGLWLKGEEVTASVKSWEFAAETDEIFIETNPWYGIPHSTTIWSVVVDNNIYIGSYGLDKKVWEKNLVGNANARLGISGKLYRVIASKIDDEKLSTSLSLAYNSKYDMAEVFGEEIPVWWFYSIKQH